MKWHFLILCLLPSIAFSQLSLNKYVTSNMVLQREQPIVISGKGKPFQIVDVILDKEHRTATISKDSSWNVIFHAREASKTPIVLHVSSGNEKLFAKDILVGDVWLCSGQSNMEFPLKSTDSYQQEKLKDNQPLIRFCNPAPAGRYVYGIPYTDSLNRRLTQNRFYEGAWTLCDSLNASEFSAVGYYFAKKLATSLDIPIGVINLSIGGAPIETFISKALLKKDKRFKEKVNGDWLKNDHLPEWIRERGMQNIGDHSNGFRDELGLNHAYKPGFAYECGIEPLHLSIKGILWYQGESNAQEMDRVLEYPALQKMLIKNYRDHWHDAKLPFYWVQLSSVDTPYYKSQLWPIFRDEQRLLLNEINNAGMAVCHDYGNRKSVHPTNKEVVGERLARWALYQDYHQNVLPSGPLPVKAIYKNGHVEITFRYSGDGLKTSIGSVVKGFSLNGKDAVAATINGKEVSIPTMSKPSYVYYSWQLYTDGNLVNSDNLPTSTFKIAVQ